MAMSALIALIQIVVIDVLMAADNAIAVGMVAATVSLDKRKKVMLYGTLAAVVLRISFALLAVHLLKVVGLTLAGGFLLAYVAYDMYRELYRGGSEATTPVAIKSDRSVFRAVALVVFADVSMSLDNVLAVAGAANGNVAVLIGGLLISVTLMSVAATFLASLIQKHRWLAWIGLCMVAYIALTLLYNGSHDVWMVMAGKISL
jgi:YjbE family integral membrane protein